MQRGRGCGQRRRGESGLHILRVEGGLGCLRGDVLGLGVEWRRLGVEGRVVMVHVGNGGSVRFNLVFGSESRGMGVYRGWRGSPGFWGNDGGHLLQETGERRRYRGAGQRSPTFSPREFVHIGMPYSGVVLDMTY